MEHLSVVVTLKQSSVMAWESKEQQQRENKVQTVKQRERGRHWEYETNITSTTQNMHGIASADCQGITYSPTSKTYTDYNECSGLTHLVTLHPNMHLTVVQAVIAQGAYGLKCSVGKQIRVY